jgi:endonuclease YncB( thermonuclease family)
MEAKAFTVSKVIDQTISLTYDEASCTDRFGRTLAYVKVGDLDLNAELVKQGLGCFLFIAPGGAAREEEFATYEAEAQTNRTGMWGACTSIPCRQ